MSSSRFIHALYDDDDTLLKAVKNIRSEKYDINEVYTPFPVRGLDKALGIEETRIAIMAFIYGCIGFSVSILMQSTWQSLSHFRQPIQSSISTCSLDLITL